MRGEGNIRLHHAYSLKLSIKIAWRATRKAALGESINGQDSVQASGVATDETPVHCPSEVIRNKQPIRQLHISTVAYSPMRSSSLTLLDECVGDYALVDEGARRQRRFSFSIVDVPASYQRNLLRACHLTGTCSAFILSSGSLMEGMKSILIPDPAFQGTVARSTPPLVSSARPLLYSTGPPTLPTSSAAPRMRREPWAE